MSDYNLAPYSEDANPQAISPEGAKVANTYLSNGCSIFLTSRQLEMPTHEISVMLDQPLIRRYVNGVLKEAGITHMQKLAERMDALIEKKWEELEEAEMGSNKDIADLIALAHKMRQDMVKFLQEDTKLSGPVTQKNTQVNIYGEGAYGDLMKKLVEGT